MLNSVTAAQAKQTLLDVYADLAPSEALTRALVCERNGDRQFALMWSDIYKALCADEHKPLGSEIVRL